MKTVTLYFDVISPYSWIAAIRFPSVARATGAQFVMEPVVFGAILSSLGTLGPAETPARRAYTIRDGARLATALRRNYEGPPTHPFNPLKALRLCTAVPAGEERNRLATALLEATWERGVDLTDGAQLQSVANSAGFDGPALLAKTEDPAVKAQLKGTTETAIARGAFGVPTFFVDNEIFFGSDRMELLDLYLRGKLRLDEERVKAALARPASIARKR